MSSFRASNRTRWQLAPIVGTFFLAVALLTVPGSSPAHAQSSSTRDPYTVENINVDVTRDTAAQARADAITQAHREAFSYLLRRLVPADAYDRLPQLSDAEILQLTSGLQVQGERSSATRYVGRLAISFRPEFVTQMLRQYNLPFASRASAPLLVLPVYRWAGTDTLWDDPNPWRQAWATRGPADGLVPTVLPEGDLSDVGALNAAQAVDMDEARLSALATRYGASGGIVAIADYGVDPASGQAVMNVSVKPFGQTPASGPYQVRSTGPAEAPPEQLAFDAIPDVLAPLEEAWRQRNLDSGYEYQNNIVVSAPLTGLRDMVTIRGRLLQVPAVTRVEVVMFSVDEARFRVYYTGSEQNLVTAAAGRDLDFVRDGLNWRISTALTTGTRGR